MSVEAIGESVGRRYRIVEAIGTGGLGTVYKAVDTRLQRLVALKVLPLKPDAESRQRFLREAQVLASLDHPNIVRIFDVGEVSEFLYLAVEYVEGRNLRQIMVDAQRLDLDYVIKIMAQVSIALGYAHRRGIIHRDIKPENIMISADGRVLLLDFGLAIAPGVPTVTSSGTVIGTIFYMSPEQLLAKPVDARSDIFSLGLVFYELLTGRRAFSGESVAIRIRNIVAQVPSPPRSIEPSIPASIDEIAMKAIAKEPDERFQTIDEFLSTLSRAKHSSLQEGTPSMAFPGRDITVFGRPGRAYTDVDKLSTRAIERSRVAMPRLAPVAVRKPRIAWLVSGLFFFVLGIFAVIMHSLKITLLAVVGGTVALCLFYSVHLARSKREKPAAAVPSVAVPPPPLIQERTFENSETPTAEFLPYDLSSADVPKTQTLQIAQDVFDRYTTLFMQHESRVEIPDEVRRRLEEFDAIWDQLTTSARHD